MAKARMLAVAGLLLAAMAAGQPARSEDDPLPGFVVGDYVLVGRQPGDGAAYKGAATIAPGEAGELVLERRLAAGTIRAEGRLEAPSSPGEGKALNFRWDEGGAMLMSCLIGSDLDNYARLTCLWGRENGEDRPGLEAMFPAK